MSLLNNNNKNKKDKKKGAANNPSFPAPKAKFNSKSVQKNTRLTGGTNRGS
jgi:hypothetical protein